MHGALPQQDCSALMNCDKGLFSAHEQFGILRTAHKMARSVFYALLLCVIAAYAAPCKDTETKDPNRCNADNHNLDTIASDLAEPEEEDEHAFWHNILDIFEDPVSDSIDMLGRDDDSTSITSSSEDSLLGHKRHRFSSPDVSDSQTNSPFSFAPVALPSLQTLDGIASRSDSLMISSQMTPVDLSFVRFHETANQNLQTVSLSTPQPPTKRPRHSRSKHLDVERHIDELHAKLDNLLAKQQKMYMLQSSYNYEHTIYTTMAKILELYATSPKFECMIINRCVVGAEDKSLHPNGLSSIEHVSSSMHGFVQLCQHFRTAEPSTVRVKTIQVPLISYITCRLYAASIATELVFTSVRVPSISPTTEADLRALIEVEKHIMRLHPLLEYMRLIPDDLGTTVFSSILKRRQSTSLTYIQGLSPQHFKVIRHVIDAKNRGIMDACVFLYKSVAHKLTTMCIQECVLSILSAGYPYATLKHKYMSIMQVAITHFDLETVQILAQNDFDLLAPYQLPSELASSAFKLKRVDELDRTNYVPEPINSGANALFFAVSRYQPTDTDDYWFLKRMHRRYSTSVRAQAESHHELNMVSFLKEHGVNLAAVDPLAKSLLRIAVIKNSMQLVQMLLQHDPSLLLYVGEDGKHPIFDAVHDGDVYMVTMLLAAYKRYPYLLTRPDAYSCTVFDYLTCMVRDDDQTEIVILRKLLDHVDKNQRNYYKVCHQPPPAEHAAIRNLDRVQLKEIMTHLQSTLSPDEFIARMRHIAIMIDALPLTTDQVHPKKMYLWDVLHSFSTLS